MIEFKTLVLIAVSVFAVGVFAGTKLHGQRRLWLILPAALLLGLVAYVATGIRVDDRRAEEIFLQLDDKTELTSGEAQSLQMLAQSSSRVREKVLHLAFANPMNAAIALPRMEFLLQATLQFDADGKRRQRLWERVVQPAVRRQSATEILALSAATADVLRLGSNQVGEVIRPLLTQLQRESKASTRYDSACILASLADRVPADQSAAVSGFLAQAALAITNLARGDAVTSLREISAMVDGVAKLTNHQSAELVQPVIAYALAELERETNTMRCAKLGSELALFKAYLRPGEAEQTLRLLIRAMADRRPAYVVPELGDAAAELVARVSPGQVEPLVEQIVSELARESNAFVLDPFFKPLASLVARLDPEANARFMKRMVDLMVRGTSQDAFRQFSGAVTSAVARVSAAQASPLAEAMFAHLLKEPNSVTRAATIPTFVRLLRQLGPAEAKPLAARLEAGLDIILTRGDASELGEQVTALAAAASRLDAEEAKAFAERMLVRLETHKGHVMVLSQLLIAVEPQLDGDARKRAVQSLSSAISGPASAYQLNTLLERLEGLHAPLGPDARGVIVERVVRAVEESGDCAGLASLVRLSGPLLDSLSPNQAKRVGDCLLAAAENGKSVVPSFDTLRDFAGKLDAEQSRRAVDLIMTRIKNTNPGTVSWLLRALKPFADKLEPSAAASLMEQMLTTMEQQGYTVTTMGTAANLPAVAERLEATQARKFAERIVVALENTTDSLALGGLTGRQRLGRLTDGLPVYTRFVARTEAGTDSWRVAVLCRTLSPLLAKLPSGEARELGRRVAARFQNQGWHAPLVFDEAMPVALQFAPEESLAKVLDGPLAVGGLRQAVLRALEMKGNSTRAPM